MVVAQLAEQSLLIPEVRWSNPVTSKKNYFKYLRLIDYFKTGSGQLFRDTPMICGGFDKDDGYLASDKCFSLVNGSWHEEVSMGIGIGEA